MKEEIEIKTTCNVDPPLTQIEIATALLTDVETKSLFFEASTLVVANKYRFNSTEQALAELIKYLKEDAIVKQKITFEEKQSFHNVTACGKIARKFGLSDFREIGTRKKIRQLEVGSRINLKDPEASTLHIKKYARVIRALKQAFPNTIFPIPDDGCITSVGCDPRLMKLLQELLADKNDKDSTAASVLK